MNTQTEKKLDKSLAMLADILREFGVEELMINEDGNHHIINTQADAESEMIDSFCAEVRKIYEVVITGK